ncbi:MAG: hypothetical protein H6567_03665 [Lewinellaceae bacterium]|nr:hypothetical protein [Lewinellaceae bacterium]
MCPSLLEIRLISAVDQSVQQTSQITSRIYFDEMFFPVKNRDEKVQIANTISLKTLENRENIRGKLISLVGASWD